MNKFQIETSVVSLANPWLEFLEEKQQIEMAPIFNEELENLCSSKPGRLYGFGVLPLKNIAASVLEFERISKLPHLRGIILDAKGKGDGLDDPELLPIFAKAQELDQMIFVHPHSGVGRENFGKYGHSLFLALGFPFETATQVIRLVLAGVLDKFPNLKLLLAHSGGVIPYLAGRLDVCVKKDENVDCGLKHPPTFYLKKLYYDAICYHSPTLNCVLEFVGISQLLFGTDHPFSISEPESLYESMSHLSLDQQQAIKKDNAKRILKLE